MPDARVIHLVGRSSGVDRHRATRTRLPHYWFESRRRYFRTHLGPIPALLADLAWASGFTLFRLRQLVQRKRDDEPQRYLSDLINHNFSNIFR